MNINGFDNFVGRKLEHVSLKIPSGLTPTILPFTVRVNGKANTIRIPSTAHRWQVTLWKDSNGNPLPDAIGATEANGTVADADNTTWAFTMALSERRHNIAANIFQPPTSGGGDGGGSWGANDGG